MYIYLLYPKKIERERRVKDICKRIKNDTYS